MIIHTVYRPEENINFIEDWLRHHLKIGIKHFYLYDNGGSVGNHVKISHGSTPGITKYRYKYNHTDLDGVRAREKQILDNYPVTKISWQPKDNNNNTIYDWFGALRHFSNENKKGLCAFIDIDEFIIPVEKFYPSRMYQKKFKNRWEYSSVHDCFDACNIPSEHLDTKTIIDLDMLSDLPENIPDPHPQYNMHFNFLSELPISKNYYNHYNHNAYAHKLLIKDRYGWYGDKDSIKKIPGYDKVYYKVNQTGLRK